MAIGQGTCEGTFPPVPRPPILWNHYEHHHPTERRERPRPHADEAQEQEGAGARGGGCAPSRRGAPLLRGVGHRVGKETTTQCESGRRRAGRAGAGIGSRGSAGARARSEVATRTGVGARAGVAAEGHRAARPRDRSGAAADPELGPQSHHVVARCAVGTRQPDDAAARSRPPRLPHTRSAQATEPCLCHDGCAGIPGRRLRRRGGRHVLAPPFDARHRGPTRSIDHSGLGLLGLPVAVGH